MLYLCFWHQQGGLKQNGGQVSNRLLTGDYEPSVNAAWRVCSCNGQCSLFHCQCLHKGAFTSTEASVTQVRKRLWFMDLWRGRGLSQCCSGSVSLSKSIARVVGQFWSITLFTSLKVNMGQYLKCSRAHFDRSDHIQPRYRTFTLNLGCILSKIAQNKPQMAGETKWSIACERA